MEEPVALNEEASKENEQTLANLSPAEEATSKDDGEIKKFLQAQKSKNTQYKTKSDLNTWKKICESLKESRARPFISIRKQDGTEYETCTLSGFQRSFQRHLHEIKKEVRSTFLRITSSPTPERFLLPNERTWSVKEKETVQMPQES